MRMDEIGWHHVHDAAFKMDRPTGVGDWLLLLIKTPAVIDGQSVPSGTLILYSPEHPQHYGTNGSQYIDDWMHFEPDNEEKSLLNTLQIPLNTPITLKNSNALSKLLREINFEFYSANRYRQEIVDAQFRILLFQIAEQLPAELSPEELADRLTWIHDSIYRKPFDYFDAVRFAAELSVTPEQFETMYQKQFAIAFTDDIRRSVLGYGLMRMNTDLTAEEAAQICGYGETEEFLAQLRQYYPDEI
ncbi:hypothetical protein [Ruminococcus sp.]|uniref:hypothetical protein n=1 Tax=Ruminococcus sp. TaxID=41978 RepID=UPI0026059958|nr:hypothetical protein [Ruminococcus sp.]MDD7555707.1 hypothetical protein [Ruminococcus sp.]